MSRKINKLHLRAYLDTDIIQGYLWGKQDEKRGMRKILEKLKGSRLSVKVPFVVVGELINNLMRGVDPKDRDVILSKFLSFQGTFNIDLVPPSKLTYSIVIKLQEKDPLLKPSDALLVSQALSDTWSAYLLTTDKVLLHSLAIKDYEESMRKDKKRKQHLVITPEFPKRSGF